MIKHVRDRLAKAPALIRITTLIGLLLLSWLPIAIPCYTLISDTNLVSIVTLVVLYGQFLGWLYVWGKQIDRTRSPWKTYGFRQPWNNLQDLGLGFVMASSCLWGLFCFAVYWNWAQWQLPTNAEGFALIVAQGFWVSLGVGLAEELFFRGWLLSELSRDYPHRISLVGTSLVFALLHFIKPLPEVIRTLPQFGGLVLLGLILVWARWATQGRLGLSIGLHAGLVSSYYWIHVGNLIQYTHRVPEWVTGIEGNPLAGLAGLCTLGWLAIMVRSLPKRRFMA